MCIYIYIYIYIYSTRTRPCSSSWSPSWSALATKHIYIYIYTHIIHNNKGHPVPVPSLRAEWAQYAGAIPQPCHVVSQVVSCHSLQRPAPPRRDDATCQDIGLRRLEFVWGWGSCKLFGSQARPSCSSRPWSPFGACSRRWCYNIYFFSYIINTHVCVYIYIYIYTHTHILYYVIWYCIMLIGDALPVRRALRGPLLIIIMTIIVITVTVTITTIIYYSHYHHLSLSLYIYIYKCIIYPHLSLSMYLHYIYIYREREREIDIDS